MSLIKNERGTPRYWVCLVVPSVIGIIIYFFLYIFNPMFPTFDILDILCILALSLLAGTWFYVWAYMLGGNLY